MTEHGINTTKADYWVHLFPLEAMVYWYRVEQMREYLRLRNLVETIGRSKDQDKTATGRGFLVRRTAYLVSGEVVPGCFLDDVDWKKLTDREAGLNGEAVVAALIERRVVKFPILMTTVIRSKDSQYSAVDFSLKYFAPIHVEAKTERPDNCHNLFVQTHERAHRPNVTPAGEIRVVQMPALVADEVPF